MPMGGGDPKQLSDGMVVKMRPEVGRGFSSLQDVRDAFVALCEELDDLYALIAAAGDFAAFKAAAGSRGSRQWLKLYDDKNGIH